MLHLADRVVKGPELLHEARVVLVQTCQFGIAQLHAIEHRCITIVSKTHAVNKAVEFAAALIDEGEPIHVARARDRIHERIQA